MLSHTHSLMCESEKAHELQSPQVWPDHPAFPARLVLTVSFVLFPAIGLSCHRCRSRCASIVTCVTPASRCQNHTTSSSAKSVTRQLTASRPSHPALYARDDRDTPLLMEAGWRINAGDLGLRSTRADCDTLARRANHLARTKCCQAQFPRIPDATHHEVVRSESVPQWPREGSGNQLPVRAVARVLP